MVQRQKKGKRRVKNIRGLEGSTYERFTRDLATAKHLSSIHSRCLIDSTNTNFHSASHRNRACRRNSIHRPRYTFNPYFSFDRVPSRRGNNPRCNSIRNVTSTDSLEWNLYSANLWVKFHEDRSSINRTNNEIDLIEIVRGGDREIEGEEERGRDYFEEGTIGI